MDFYGKCRNCPEGGCQVNKKTIASTDFCGNNTNFTYM